MAEADIVVKERYVADMSHAVPIEPHAVVAQWQGDRVTIWSSTQVPFIARSGVATTLELPEAHVRIVVPHLGGGFGGKCEFHYEAQVAALARVAQRPVRLVFSRREEFLAPDHRREGQVLELETGVRRDGSIVARRGRLILDNGAYSADAPFFPQLAAMMAAGPYKIENVFIDASLAYTNTTPSGSVRAPTAPQACWALEQHMDSVAGQLGMDPVEFRRRNIVRNGDEGPTRQVFEDIGAAETLERAVELIGYGKELPEDEAIGVAVGWWPSFGIASGAYVKINGDGSATIITGAQECGTGAVMALPLLAAEILGMEPESFSLLYQDTDAGPVRLRRIRLTDHLQQRPRRDGRGERRAGAAARPGRRAAGGQPRRPGAEGRRRLGEGLAHQVGHHPGAGRGRPRQHPAARPRRRRGAGDARLGRVRMHRPAGIGVVPRTRRSSRMRCAARSIARRASCGCWRWPRCTSRDAC